MTTPNERLAIRGRVRVGGEGVGPLLVATVAVFIIFAAMKPGVFLTLENARSMAYQIPEVALLSMAVMLSMLTGGIDLSIVAVANMAAITTASLIATSTTGAPGTGDPVIVAGAIVAGIIVGVACGVGNGLLITRVGVPPILATLGTGQLLNGLAIGWTSGTVITNLPLAFTALGNWTLLGVPIPLIILVGALILVALILNRSALGLRIVLVGANPLAARYSGIDTTRTLVFTYAMSAFLASLAGLVIAARSGSASADYGGSYLLFAIVVAVLGGINPAGGFGRVSGVMLAVILLQLVSSGINAVVQPSIAPFVQGIVTGLVLIGVIVAMRLASSGGLDILRRALRGRGRSEHRASQRTRP